MLVIDASALVDALLLAGPARARLSAANLHAPELIDAELLSVLRLVLANKLLESQALQGLSAYDALYVALAEQLQAPLLTADARLARAQG